MAFSFNPISFDLASFSTIGNSTLPTKECRIEILNEQSNTVRLTVTVERSQRPFSSTWQTTV